MIPRGCLDPGMIGQGPERVFADSRTALEAAEGAYRDAIRLASPERRLTRGWPPPRNVARPWAERYRLSGSEQAIPWPFP